MPQLLMFWIFPIFCITGCVPMIYKNNFYHIGSDIWSLDSNVYEELVLVTKGNPRILCGAKCGAVDNCRGMEVCDGQLCRLWNDTFTTNITGNTSNKTCRRYSKFSGQGNSGNIYSQTESFTTELQIYTSGSGNEISATDTMTNASSDTQTAVYSNPSVRPATDTQTTASSTLRLSVSSTYSSTTAGLSEMTTTAGIPKQNCVTSFEFLHNITKEVPCHNDSFHWIVIQRRYNGEINFYRNWNDYKYGFGSVYSEIWLGNKFIHQLTMTRGYTHLKIELLNFDGGYGFAEYDFNVDDELNQYRIYAAWKTGNTDDSLWPINGAYFGTYDRDNDGHNAKVCTDEYQGGWWYTWDAFCTEANLNGVYYNTSRLEKTGIFWFGMSEISYDTLKEVRMMIRQPASR